MPAAAPLDSTQVLITLITAVCSVLTAVLTAFVHSRVGQVKREINGRLTAFLELTERHAASQGNAAGRKELAGELAAAAGAIGAAIAPAPGVIMSTSPTSGK